MSPRLSLRRGPTRVGDAVYVGAVWTNGEPILVADAADAGAWRGSERFDDVLAAFEGRNEDTAPIEGIGYALQLGFDDGTLDVFRLDDGRVLLVGVMFGSSDDWPAFVRSALAAERGPVGTLDVRSGRVALVSSAADWEDVGKVAANPRRAAPKRRHPADDALLLDCAAGPHQLLYTFLEQSEFGLQTWLLA